METVAALVCGLVILWALELRYNKIVGRMKKVEDLISDLIKELKTLNTKIKS